MVNDSDPSNENKRILNEIANALPHRKKGYGTFGTPSRNIQLLVRYDTKFLRHFALCNINFIKINYEGFHSVRKEVPEWEEYLSTTSFLAFQQDGTGNIDVKSFFSQYIKARSTYSHPFLLMLLPTTTL